MYAYSIKFIQTRIKEKHPHAHAEFTEPTKIHEHKQLRNYLLWMCEEIKKNKKDPLKASRWIGWIFSKMESMGMMTNDESRNCAMRDKDGVEAETQKIYGKKSKTV